VLALGSRPNDFAIPGLAERTITLYSVADAERVWAAANQAAAAAAATPDPGRQRRLATVVVGGGGATGVELAGELAETLPEVARGHGLAPKCPTVVLVEAGPSILAGSSTALVARAREILDRLGVTVRTGATIAEATAEGFRLRDGQLVEGGVFVWAGGVKAPEVVAGSELPTGHNGRVKVDQHLRVLDHPEIYAAGDLASVVDPAPGAPCRRWPRLPLRRPRSSPTTSTPSWTAGHWRRSAFTTRGSSYRSVTTVALPSSPGSPAAGGSPTCSKTPSSGSTANPSSISTAGTP
jgi:NADH:ubiquinone reductase (H+-translocating)